MDDNNQPAIKIDMSRRMAILDVVRCREWTGTQLLRAIGLAIKEWLYGIDGGLWSMVAAPAKPHDCNHSHQECGLIRWCAECGHVLFGQDQIGMEVGQFQALERSRAEWEAIALYLRQNYSKEIGDGEHTGLTDSQVVVRYLARERAYMRAVSSRQKTTALDYTGD